MYSNRYKEDLNSARIEQVRKGGFPPLMPDLNGLETGGKPPFLTCSILEQFDKSALIVRN